MEDMGTLLKMSVSRIRDCDRLEPIHKGYSKQSKYKVVRPDGHWLLRVGTWDQYARMEAEFEVLQSLQGHQVRIPVPVACGRVDSLGISYYIVTYIEGVEARDILPHLPESVQHHIGVEAGRDLRRMHHLPAPSSVGPWSVRCMAKHHRYVEAYRNCGIELKHGDAILSMIDDNAELLRRRPNVFQHDDFHVSNLIVNGNGYAGAIDFNRFDWGDPIHDFVKRVL